MVKDRRIYQRLDGIVNVRYAVRGRDKEKIESVPRNIGGGGMGVCLAEKLYAGTILDFEITVPDNPGKAVLGVGEVSWSRPFGTIEGRQSVSIFETGIKFINIDPIAIGRVYTYFHNMMPRV